MTATLELNNIGGFKGTKTFQFTRGALTEIEAPNAVGKTTIARGLAAVLSFPLNHPETIKEAGNQGILRESLKNIYEKDASVRLQYNGLSEEWAMGSDGTLVHIPLHGDERFVLAGMLTQEARTIRQLVEGNADFSWVARLLSWGQRYAKAKDFTQARVRDVDLEIGKIHKRQEELAERDMQLQDGKRLRSELEKKRQDFACQLDEQKRAHVEEISKLGKRIDSLNQDLANQEAMITRIKREIESFQDKLQSNAKNAKEIEKQLNQIDLDKTREEVLKHVNAIDHNLKRLRRSIGALNAQMSTFTDAKAVLEQRGEEEGTCPVCGVSKVTRGLLEEKLDDLRSQIDELKGTERSLSSERSRWLQKEATERRQIEALSKALQDLTKEGKDLSHAISRRKTSFDLAAKTREELAGQHSKLNEQKRLLEKQTEQWERKTHEALKDIEGQLDTVSGTITEQLRKLREESFVEILGRHLSLDKALDCWDNYKINLSDIIDYLDQRQHDHEVKAVAQFNRNIKKVMADLGFSEFDQIAIDQDTKELKVFREGFVHQPLESLSTSEKYSISIVLQITLKQTYLPDIPFFIVDEVVVSYDQDRKGRILSYLSTLAKENDLFVIVTKLAERPGTEIIVRAR